MDDMNTSAMFLSVALAVSQCGGPPPNPRSPEYPCGTRAHACATAPLSCCWDSQVCGGQVGSGCPAGMCCYAGEGFMSSRNDDAGKIAPEKQWR